MKIRFGLLIFCLLLSGCMLKPIKMESPARYTLKGVSTKRYATVSSHLTILVSQLNTNPGFQSEEIVYVNKPYQINNFSKSSWVAPPSQLLLPVLVESLRNTHYFRAVMSPPFAGVTDIRLEGQLIALQQEFYARHSQVRLAMQVTLIDNRSNQILASRSFSDVVMSKTSDPYGGVVAANTATAGLMQQITEFVVATVRKTFQHLGSN